MNYAPSGSSFIALLGVGIAVAGHLLEVIGLIFAIAAIFLSLRTFSVFVTGNENKKP